MKTLTKININKIRFLVTVMVLGLIVGLLAGPAMAQAPTKNKKGDKIPHAELKEAKVIAQVVSSVQEIAPMKIKLNVLNPTGKSVRIAILNYENLPVYQESFTGKEYNKILNFSITPVGRYSLRITGHKQVEIRRFAIDSKRRRNLTASPMENLNGSNVMAAIYENGQNNIILHVVNNTGKPIDYVFRNDAREVLYRGIIKAPTFTKIFNLAESGDGNYSFVVNNKTIKAAYRTFAMQTVYDRSFAWTNKRGRPLKPTDASLMTLKTNN